MTYPSAETTAHLLAATAAIRSHISCLVQRADRPPHRSQLDDVHAHLAELLRLLDHLARTTRPQHPAAGRRLAEAHTSLWKASAHVHDAFHLLPAPGDEHQLPDGPPVLGICRRHLTAGHAVRRAATPAELSRDPSR